LDIEPWILATVLLCLLVAFCSLWRNRKSRGKECCQILDPDSVSEPETAKKGDNISDNVRRDFVANVSHELRTPVAIVKGFAETLDDDYDELSGKKRREFIGKIRKNSDRLCSLVEDLLQLAELESPSQALSLENGYLATVAKTVAERFEEQLDQEIQSIRLELAKEEKTVRFDPVKIERVIENLLDNALRYARDFSVITIRTIIGDEAQEIRCEVEDDGGGIPGKDLPHLFERFYRVDKGRSRESGGTGLGLSIVKHVVELHGGAVTARSEVDQGTAFGFSLPYRT
jgi:signal transduction histidine kinase|tara:strand:- start:315 stop:1175 length:861 start_codon:yes stop_codon:yes gene_type:complete